MVCGSLFCLHGEDSLPWQRDYAYQQPIVWDPVRPRSQVLRQLKALLPTFKGDGDFVAGKRTRLRYIGHCLYAFAQGVIKGSGLPNRVPQVRGIRDRAAQQGFARQPLVPFNHNRWELGCEDEVFADTNTGQAMLVRPDIEPDAENLKKAEDLVEEYLPI